MLQLNPYIAVKTKTGEGKAILVIDHGSSIPLEWVVINEKTGEFESWRTQDIKPLVGAVGAYYSAPSLGAAPSSFTTGQNQTLEESKGIVRNATAGPNSRS